MCDDCWIISGLISGGVALIVSLILIGVSVATMEPVPSPCGIICG